MRSEGADVKTTVSEVCTGTHTAGQQGRAGMISNCMLGSERRCERGGVDAWIDRMTLASIFRGVRVPDMGAASAACLPQQRTLNPPLEGWDVYLASSRPPSRSMAGHGGYSAAGHCVGA